MARANVIAADVLTYLRRALPHVQAGRSVTDAMRAVLDDDARLLNAAFKRAGSQFFPTPDERGRAHQPLPQVGDEIFTQISLRVHAAAVSA